MNKEKFKQILSNRVNLLKLSGINEYILLDIYESSYYLKVFKTSKLGFNLFSNQSENNYKVILEKFDSYSELYSLKKILSGLIKDQNLSNPYLILGINECRQSLVSIPNDVEDIELWFLENSNSYLPEGLNNHDFLSSYQIISESDDNDNFQVVSARKEYLNQIQKVFKNDDTVLLSILPFNIHKNINQSEDETSFLSINILPHKISYSFQIDNSRPIIDELYGDFVDMSTHVMNELEIVSKVSEILNIVIGSSNERINKLRLQLTSPFNLGKEISNKVTSISKGELIKEAEIDFRLGDNLRTTLENLVIFFDESINLVEADLRETEREKIEKTFTQRLIITCGTILIIPLLFLYLFEGQIGSSIQAQEDGIIEANSNRKIVENLQKQKSNFVNNLSTLIDLKKGNKSLSNIIEMVSDICPDKNCFIEFKTTKKEFSQRLTFIGITSEQSNIPKIMSTLEESKLVKNVDLVFSNSIRKKDVPKNLSKGRTYYKYNIEADYDENRK